MEIESVEADYGEKMIQLKISFFTNLPGLKEDHIRQKHAWASGHVRIQRNSAHGIDGNTGGIFHSMSELPMLIENLLIEQGITIHQSRNKAKLFAVD
jgi:hypothetical protein